MNATARYLLLFPFAALLSWVPLGVAYSQQPSAPLPPGHPPIGAPQGSAQQALPEGHPPINGPLGQAPALPADEEDDSENTPLPPGHPPIGGADAQPMGAAMGLPARGAMAVVDDPSLRPGSAVLQLRDARGQPVKGLDLVLQIIRRTIAEGESRSEKSVRVDDAGLAKFDGLQIGSEWSYQAHVKFSSISYSTPLFQLSQFSGKRVTLLVFDSTTNIDAPPVGVQAFLALEPREEFLQIEQVLHFANMGDRTWIIPETIVALQSGFQAFQNSDDGSEVRVEQLEGRGYRLTGFVRPGPHEVSFRYQIPFHGADSVRFAVGLPPRVAQLRVLSSIAGSSRMRVDGLPEPTTTRGSDGQRVLITERTVAPGDDQIEVAGISMRGLPIPGPARWYALFGAVAAVMAGVFLAIQAKRNPNPFLDPNLRGDIEQAKKQVLDEIAALELARKSGELGPKTYEQSRRALIDSLSRLLAIEKNIGSTPSA